MLVSGPNTKSTETELVCTARACLQPPSTYRRDWCQFTSRVWTPQNAQLFTPSLHCKWTRLAHRSEWSDLAGRIAFFSAIKAPLTTTTGDRTKCVHLRHYLAPKSWPTSTSNRKGTTSCPGAISWPSRTMCTVPHKCRRFGTRMRRHNGKRSTVAIGMRWR